MTDMQHFTEEEIEQNLRTALDITERLQPPDDLRQAVFATAAQRLHEKTIIHGAPALLPMQGRIQ